MRLAAMFVVIAFPAAAQSLNDTMQNMLRDQQAVRDRWEAQQRFEDQQRQIDHQRFEMQMNRPQPEELHIGGGDDWHPGRSPLD